jgi:putative FmdB family regulatory protein
MPTYEYVCAKCGHEFEQFQSIAANPLATCPEDACLKRKWGRGKVKRKLSTGGGLIFKGSGFYITDYRSEGYKQAAKKDSETAKPAASADTKAAAPAKPAAKSEAKPAKAGSKD